MNRYALTVSDSLEITDLTRRNAERMIVNFADCLTEDGNLPAGTTWFHVDETIKPCTITDEGDGIETIRFDGKYTVKGLGGYELGRGCFYKKINKN